MNDLAEEEGMGNFRQDDICGYCYLMKGDCDHLSLWRTEYDANKECDAMHARLAEVERERDKALVEVDEYEHLSDLQRKREQPWIEQWRVETGQPLSLPDYGQMLGWILDKADAAQARVQVLEEALRTLRERERRDL